MQTGFPAHGGRSRHPAPWPSTARTDEVGDGGQLPEVLQELMQGVAVLGGDPVLVL